MKWKKKRKKIEGETGTEENRHGQHLDLTCMRVDRSERNMRSTVKSASRNLLCFGKAELQLQAEAELPRLLVIRALSANEFLLGAFALILT